MQSFEIGAARVEQTPVRGDYTNGIGLQATSAHAGTVLDVIAVNGFSNCSYLYTGYILDH